MVVLAGGQSRDGELVLEAFRLLKLSAGAKVVALRDPPVQRL